MQQLKRLHAGVSLASWCANVLLIPELPSQIPMHWRINGQVDRWGDKKQYDMARGFRIIILGFDDLASEYRPGQS
ncbi:MAG: hypothetical protein DRP70_06270 [Spirochaetes bacterium]|nr:MAG: hypothetical protein DRP49_08765 [Spirochaetota bacterium]RKX81637.1 MAG: hypothetical protein DRP60_00125 [Spirochaetota bacterium]RKX88606.1 MAG: hypothetical protein DRP70_06270 [Spirochaetota bacterium]RKX98486.1 MAG: hypothetical protein DRZ90_02690 [Spirochaetota bacterium]